MLDNLKSNQHTMYKVIWGQCSKNMQTKLKALTDYLKETEADNCAWLLNQIKGAIHQFNTEEYIYFSLTEAREAYMNCRQAPGQSDADYYAVFNTVVDVLEYFEANVAENDKLVLDTKEKAYSATERRSISRDRTLAAVFLKHSDPMRYSGLLADLKNQYGRGVDQYPKDLNSAYRLLVNFDDGVVKPEDTNKLPSKKSGNTNTVVDHTRSFQ